MGLGRGRRRSRGRGRVAGTIFLRGLSDLNSNTSSNSRESVGAGEATAVTPRARDTTAGAAVSTAAAAAEAGARGAAAAEVRGNRAAPRPGESSLQPDIS